LFYWQMSRNYGLHQKTLYIRINVLQLFFRTLSYYGPEYLRPIDRTQKEWEPWLD
jgi:hypothetical protein